MQWTQITHLLPLWMHCIDWEADQFVVHQAKLEGLYESWKQWVAPLWFSSRAYYVSEQSLCYQGYASNITFR